MTPEERVKGLGEKIASDCAGSATPFTDYILHERIEKLIAQIVREAIEEEREACARVADEFVAMAEESDGWLGNTGLQKATARRIARLIRMRSKR